MHIMVSLYLLCNDFIDATQIRILVIRMLLIVSILKRWIMWLLISAASVIACFNTFVDS